MNYYNNFKNFDYLNSNLYNEFISQSNDSVNSNNLYDPYNGLIRGNLFKQLYEPYKLKEPYEIKPMNEQARMLTEIDSLGFAIIDLNLYLDIFPNDTEKINLYNQYRTRKKNIINEYEQKYGPITLNSNNLNITPWAWNNMPWPWDN